MSYYRVSSGIVRIRDRDVARLLTAKAADAAAEGLDFFGRVTDCLGLTHHAENLKVLFNEIWTKDNSLEKTSGNLTKAIFELRDRLQNEAEKKTFDENFRLMTVSPIDNKTKITVHKAILGFAGSTFAECDLTEAFDAYDCHLTKCINKYTPLNKTAGRYKINTNTELINLYKSFELNLKQCYSEIQNITHKTNTNLTNVILELRSKYPDKQVFDDHFRLKVDSIVNSQTGEIVDKVILEFAGTKFAQCDLTEKFNKENCFFTIDSNKPAEFKINSLCADYASRIAISINSSRNIKSTHRAQFFRDGIRDTKDIILKTSDDTRKFIADCFDQNKLLQIDQGILEKDQVVKNFINYKSVTEKQSRLLPVALNQDYKIGIISSLSTALAQNNLFIPDFNNLLKIEFDLTDSNLEGVDFTASYNNEAFKATAEIKGKIIFRKNFIEELNAINFESNELGIEKIEIKGFLINNLPNLDRLLSEENNVSLLDSPDRNRSGSTAETVTEPNMGVT